jgi:hypothetical protein
MVLSRIGFWVVPICLATNANAVDPDGDIWAEAPGTPVRLVRIQNRKVVEEFTERDIPAAYGLLADPKDGIWLSLMNGGLARYRQRRLEIVLQRSAPTWAVSTTLWLISMGQFGAPLNMRWWVVRDDGKGIDQETLDFGKAAHFGLAGMRERSHRNWRQTDAPSTQGKGTEVNLIVPGKMIFRRRKKIGGS